VTAFFWFLGLIRVVFLANVSIFPAGVRTRRKFVPPGSKSVE